MIDPSVVIAAGAAAAACSVAQARQTACLRAPLPGRSRPQSPHRAVWTATGLAGVVIALLLITGPLAHWAGFVVAGAEIAATLSWVVTRATGERRARAREHDVVKACALLAGLLESGEIPAQALLVVAADIPLLGPAAGAVRIGGDVPAELHRIARLPGCATVDAVARGWKLCQQTGVPLAPVMRTVAETLRAHSDVRDERHAELASSRSTGRLLAGLPIIGIAMGFFVGANPVAFLTGSLAGHLCVVSAATLACAGVIWTEHVGQA